MPAGFGDSQRNIEKLAGARVRATGATDGDEDFKLVNSTASFDYVQPGWKVVNTTDDTYTYAIKPANPDGSDIHRAILLEEDIFDASEDYEVLRPTRSLLRPPNGLEPELSVIRYRPVGTPATDIYGAEVWVNNFRFLPSILEESDATEGLRIYNVPYRPTYNTAIEIRNYNKRAISVTVGALNKSMPMSAEESD